jgi:hypothetical protein
MMAAAVAMLVATTALAQQDGGASAARQACRADYRALCNGTQAGGGRIIACFRQHTHQLSADCINALKALREAHAQRG